MKMLSTPLDILFKFLSKNLNLPRKKYEKTKFTYKNMKIANSSFKNFMKSTVILWKGNKKWAFLKKNFLIRLLMYGQNFV